MMKKLFFVLVLLCLFFSPKTKTAEAKIFDPDRFSKVVLVSGFKGIVCPVLLDKKTEEEINNHLLVFLPEDVKFLNTKANDLFSQAGCANEEEIIVAQIKVVPKETPTVVEEEEFIEPLYLFDLEILRGDSVQYNYSSDKKGRVIDQVIRTFHKNNPLFPKEQKTMEGVKSWFSYYSEEKKPVLRSNTSLRYFNFIYQGKLYRLVKVEKELQDVVIWEAPPSWTPTVPSPTGGPIGEKAKCQPLAFSQTLYDKIEEKDIVNPNRLDWFVDCYSIILPAYVQAPSNIVVKFQSCRDEDPQSCADFAEFTESMWIYDSLDNPLTITVGSQKGILKMNTRLDFDSLDLPADRTLHLLVGPDWTGRSEKFGFYKIYFGFDPDDLKAQVIDLGNTLATSLQPNSWRPNPFGSPGRSFGNIDVYSIKTPLSLIDPAGKAVKVEMISCWENFDDCGPQKGFGEKLYILDSNYKPILTEPFEGVIDFGNPRLKNIIKPEEKYILFVGTDSGLSAPRLYKIYFGY